MIDLFVLIYFHFLDLCFVCLFRCSVYIHNVVVCKIALGYCYYGSLELYILFKAQLQNPS